jgi:hypothetical protein
MKTGEHQRGRRFNRIGIAMSFIVALNGCSIGGADRVHDVATTRDGTEIAPQELRMKGGSVPSERDVARARNLLDKAVQAMGGAVAIDGVRTLILRGKFHQRSAMGSFEAAVTTTFVFPDRMRRDIVLPNGTTVSTIYTPEAAFLASEDGATDYPSDERLALEASVTRNPLALLKARHDAAFRVFAPGVLTTGSVRHAILRIAIGKETADLLLDDTGAIVEWHFDVRTPSGETIPGAGRVRYSDFRPAGDLILPYASDGVSGSGQLYSTHLDVIEVNQPIAPGVFDRPVAAGENADALRPPPK